MSSEAATASKKRKVTTSSATTTPALDASIQQAIEAGIAARIDEALAALTARLAQQEATLQRLSQTTPFVDVDEGAVDEDDEHLPISPLDGRIHVSMTREQLRTIRLRNASVQQLHARIAHLEAAILAMQAQNGAVATSQYAQQQQHAFLPHPPPAPPAALALAPPWPMPMPAQHQAQPQPQPQASTSSLTLTSSPSLPVESAADAAAEALRKRHKKGKAKSSTPSISSDAVPGDSPTGASSTPRKKGGGGLKPNIHLQEAFRLQVRLEAGAPSGPIPGALEPGEPIPRHAITPAEQAAWDALPPAQREGQVLEGRPLLRFDWTLHRDDPRAVEFVRSRVEAIYEAPAKHGLTPDHLPPLDEGIEACFVTFKRIGRTARLAKQAAGGEVGQAQQQQQQQQQQEEEGELEEQV